MTLSAAALMGKFLGKGGNANVTAPHPKYTSVNEQTKAHLHDVVLHDLAQTQNIVRSSAAAAMGFNPADYSRPFSGASTTINASQQPGAQISWPAALLIAMLAALGTKMYGDSLATKANQPTASIKDSGARVRVFWGQDELLPGQSETAQP